ncbi:hydrolase [Streptomyces sp. TRM 70351]|uniref:hydrolase n=1 Tax=Streptomyces sp. TRM 70351 TaxID=3116552 RepID=UPI002E7C4460|nr:hydrolase [Streptomyces sp. TRM 70351]MEE1929389.1 hydrolase [Streptomyces sp. TRM 70351]
MPPSQPRTSRDLLLPAAQEAAELAARHAAGADTDRTLHPDVRAALLGAGFARHFVPERFGGTAGGCTELLHAVAALGTGCTSAAWCASVIAGAARMGAYLPEEGQRDLWADGPDTAVAGALVPRGSATEVSDGWRITGEWDFTSAVDFSGWALVCALVPAGDHQTPWFFAVPRGDYRVEDTWTAVGMRGTGSNTLVTDNVFVPRHRAFPRGEMLAGRPTGSTARCHTAPLRLLSGLLFAAPALGAARGALRVWSDHRLADALSAGGDADTQRTAARAATAVDAAAMLLERAARVADAEAATRVEAARNPADCALAVEQLVDVVERLYRTIGSTGQLAPHPLQRVWRDVHGLASHVALRFDTAGAAYGAQLLQLPEPPAPLPRQERQCG